MFTKIFAVALVATTLTALPVNAQTNEQVKIVICDAPPDMERLCPLGSFSREEYVLRIRLNRVDQEAALLQMQKEAPDRKKQARLLHAARNACRVTGEWYIFGSKVWETSEIDGQCVTDYMSQNN